MFTFFPLLRLAQILHLVVSRVAKPVVGQEV